ncbi:hypothetical protein DPMN_083334 [Dreissena polymorpha]|uniref:Uncharacterized protein n=1 Tax=Dreissena polymorpha TaxID=45954 RepID=A0A9D3YBQ5_DREPO|nr:hypothetical protein DPMN_083334 [Dreissena polymorpha]
MEISGGWGHRSYGVNVESSTFSKLPPFASATTSWTTTLQLVLTQIPDSPPIPASRPNF